MKKRTECYQKSIRLPIIIKNRLKEFLTTPDALKQ
jgi:hypothetical protein